MASAANAAQLRLYYAESTYRRNTGSDGIVLCGSLCGTTLDFCLCQPYA